MASALAHLLNFIFRRMPVIEDTAKERAQNASRRRHGFIEIAASGRMKKNFYTSEKTVQAQLGCYEQALADIVCYMREIV